MNKKILQLALPSIVSNITVPLLGLVDVASVGDFGGAPGSNEGFVPVGWCRDSDFSGSASAPVSDTGNSFLTIGYDG